MATLKHAESRRRYSWWWDSHISPKNSKWLQENLTDMDAKVKIMIKLIEADADTFARRAEMYYKKRPELMKLVEESYRAYRALAERYDHATGALRQAHRTMAEAFPNQVPFTDEPHTTEMPEAMQDLMFGSNEDNKERGVQNGVSGQNQVGSEYEGVGKAEDEVQILKKAIEKLEAEKEASLVQYQQSLEKLSNLETKLLHAQKGASELNERATKAENEADSLKHALSKLEAEKEAGIANYVHSVERISDLEIKISRAQEEVRGLNDRASKAETEVQTLKQALTKLEAENEAFLLRYKQCLEMISDLENKLSFAEAEARRHSERGDKSEAEVHSLKEIIANLNEAKEAAILQYQQCLETISDLGTKITRAEEETTRLNNEVEIGVEKYKSAEEQHHLLEREYQSLQLEANTLMQKMGILITHELVEKDEELVNLKARMQEEHLHLIQAQEALIRLQDLHYKSQEEQRALELELENRFQMLEEMKFQNQLLEDEIQQLKEQNENLNKQNLSSADSIKNLQGEILSLKEAIEKFKEEVELRLDQRNALQQEIYCLKEEINELNRRHKGFIDQVESVGFKPDSFGLSVKNLKNERSMLREIYQNEREEKQSLLQKLEHMEKLLQTNALLENSLSNVNVELEEVREKLKALEETCKSLQQEKSALAAEKAILVSQLKIVTENRDKLSEKNKLLENSLTEVNVELQGSRTTSKILEESFKAVKNENSGLMTERNSLVTKLESIQQRVKNLENCYTELSEKHLYLEKAKDLTLDQVAGLRASVNLDKQEHASFVHSNETHMANLENKIFVLQEEHRSMKKEFDEKQEKAMKAQMEFFIWEKSIRDVEERNLSLLIENQKHVEESRLSEKVISELEQKNLQGELNVKYLLNQVNKLRTTIYQVFKSLGNDLDYDYQGNIEEDERLLQHIIRKIENTDNLVVEIQNEKQQLLFEKSVLIALLEKVTSDLQESHLGLQSENFKLIQENRSLTNEFSNLKERNSILEKETNVMIEEIMVLSNLCLMLKSFRAEKAEELEEFGEGMEYLHGVNGGLEKEIRIIREGMDKLENELKIFKGENDQLNHQIEIGAELLSQKEMELTYAQEKLNTMESKSMEAQMKIEEYKTREESLGSQLEEKRNDVEFWEAEAEKLYRDRQISATHEVIFKEKTYELLGARENHEDKSGTHIAEIEQLRECLCVLEGENEGMKFEMAKYANDLIPLVESIKSLEELVFSEIIIPIADNHKTEDAELTNHRGDKSSEECQLEVSDGIPDLHDLQTRLQAVEKALREIKKLKMQGNSETGLKSKTSMKGAKESKTHLVRREEKPGKDIVGKPIEMELQTKNNYRETPKAEPEISIAKNKVLVKDIMLDQVAESSSYDKEFDPYSRSGRRSARKDNQFMELWEFVEKDRSINLKVNTRKSRSGRRGNSIDYQEGRKSAYSNSSVSLEDKELVIDKLEVSKSVSKAEQEGNAQKILERLSSDSKKLSNLNITVQGLKRKLEQTSKPKRADNFEYDMVDGQLQEIDEAILQLLEINGKLRKNLEVPLSRNGKAEMESEESKNVRRRKVTEQAERVSERIGRLLLEVQRIQFVLLKLDDEHEPAGTSSIAERRRRVLLRDYFYGNRRSFRTRRRKRDRLCACVRPSTVEED